MRQVCVIVRRKRASASRSLTSAPATQHALLPRGGSNGSEVGAVEVRVDSAGDAAALPLLGAGVGQVGGAASTGVQHPQQDTGGADASHTAAAGADASGGVGGGQGGDRWSPPPMDASLSASTVTLLVSEATLATALQRHTFLNRATSSSSSTTTGALGAVPLALAGAVVVRVE